MKQDKAFPEPKIFSVTVDCSCGHQHTIPWQNVVFGNALFGMQTAAWLCPEMNKSVIANNDTTNKTIKPK